MGRRCPFFEFLTTFHGWNSVNHDLGGRVTIRRIRQCWAGLQESAQDRIAAAVRLIEAHGPALPFPYSSRVNGSRHEHMRELRVQRSGRPIRIFYAFDPRRMAILLIGGDKTGNDRFYEIFVPKADELYDIHLEELNAEGLI
jgi:hypothetical protein